MSLQSKLCRLCALHSLLLFTFVNVFEWNIYNYVFLCQNEIMSHRNVCYQPQVMVPTVTCSCECHIKY